MPRGVPRSRSRTVPAPAPAHPRLAAQFKKAKTKVEKYHDEMRKLMSYLHNGRKYAPGHKWSKSQLTAITPEKIMRYLKMKIYGDEDANHDEDPPIHHRRNSVLFWKKAWSYFMLDQNHQWSEITKTGNPTRSAVFNKLLRAMKKMEAARRGKPSMARRSFIPKEFERLVCLCETHDIPEVGAWLASYVTFQLHMIARLDDTAKFRLPDLKPFFKYPDFGVTARLCWAKNCMEERDAPTQVLLGARNWRYCVLSHLGMWLELHFELNPDDGNEFVFGAEGKSDPNSIKNSAAYHLRALMKSENFTVDFADEIDDERETGSHSTRKFGVNLGRGGGKSRDDVDHRGRWKGHDRQQDQYADTTIPFVDASVAAVLCVGGAIAYFVREESGVSSEWILEHVVPHLAGGVPRQTCIVLGRALLWKVWEAAQGIDEHRVPSSITARVMAAVRDLGTRNRLEAGTNPIRRGSIAVSGIDAELYVYEIGSGGGGGGGDGGDDDNPSADRRDPRIKAGEQAAEMRFLGSEVQRLNRQIADNHEMAARRDALNRHLMCKMSKNIARLANAPGRRVAVVPANVSNAVVAQVTHRPSPLVASLIARPRTLHDLWAEWQVGGGGRKPAKDFNSGERGAVKNRYCFRKVLWYKVAEMVRAGDTAHTACDKIYAAYGENLSVTKIIRKMQVDRRSGTWPAQLTVQRL
jgi:hypothetical protein